MSDQPTSLLTPDELGAIYKTSGRTIRQWHQDGLIPAEVNAGRIIRFDREAVADALKQAADKVKKSKKRVALI